MNKKIFQIPHTMRKKDNLNLPKSYDLSRKVYNILVNKKKYEFLPIESFNLQRITSFKQSMEELLKELKRICKQDDPAIYGGEGYYVSYISQKEKLGQLKNWYLILNQIRGDLDYFSDRWCYHRFISIKRLYELFLFDYIHYFYDIKYKYNRNGKYKNVLQYLWKNAGILHISQADAADDNTFKSWREKLKPEEIKIK